MKYMKILFVLVLAVIMTSCAGTVFDLNSDPNDGEPRSPITGQVIRKTEDGGAKQVIDSKTIGYWARVIESISGKKLFDPFRNLPPVEESPAVVEPVK